MQRDRRAANLVDHTHAHHLRSQENKQFAADPLRGAVLEELAHANITGLRLGVVVYAHPGSHWYKVQLDAIGPQIPCTTIEQVAYTPIGVRSTGCIPPRSHVVVWMPPGRTHGLILGCYNPPNQVVGLTMRDFVSQGSQAGIQREDVYKLPIKNLYRNGHILDWSSGRPWDSLSNEWGRITETGIALVVDSFQAFLRVNEACGLFLNYFDSHTRLAGINMNIQSAVHEIVSKLDEGENRYGHFDYTYPWEALGLYAPGTQIHEVKKDADVQFKTAFGKLDLADADQDLQSIARYQEHGGYLGQGRLRTVMIPAPTGTGKRHYGDDATEIPDLGVFRESIALDGSYLLESAKQITFLKRSLIPVAKEVRLPEDQKTGDDARKNNYKFSGQFGSGPAHKVGDVQVTDANATLLRAAAIDDTAAYQSNWQALHPFHYHAEDYKVPEESELPNAGGPQRVQDKLDFSALGSSMYMADPEPATVKVDDRYGKTEYTQRQSGISWLPDGGVVIFDGFGSQIIMTAGNIRFECPGNVIIAPGASSITMAGRDIIQRAKHSVDLTAGDGDVRIKAEHNLMLLGGNDTEGGVLIESRSPGMVADFDGKIGEDVVSGGILLKAGNSGVTMWGGDLYLRTGGGDSNQGSIILDGYKGQVAVQGQTVDLYAADACDIWIGPSGNSDAVTATFNFSSFGAVIGGALICGGDGAFLGDVIAQNGMSCTDGFSAVNNTPYVGKIDGGSLSSAFGGVTTEINQEKAAGKTAHGEVFTNGFYKAGNVGNDTVIRQAQFGYRDNPTQYNTEDFKFPESRWQQMVRLGIASGGTGWDEPTVDYQGTPQLPWPGKDAWDGDTLLELSKLTMFDAQNGYSVDRGAAYETPVVAPFTRGVPKTDFKVIS